MLHSDNGNGRVAGRPAPLGDRQVLGVRTENGLVTIHLDSMHNTAPRCLQCGRVIDLTKVSDETPDNERPVVDPERRGFCCNRRCQEQMLNPAPRCRRRAATAS